jgi:hypothetical protein
MTYRLGCPRPEVRGYHLFDEGTREMSWLIVCHVRGKETPPTSEEFTSEVTEHPWGNVVMHVLWHAISRLVRLHYDELLGTRYEHYGRVDHEGFPFQAVMRAG